MRPGTPARLWALLGVWAGLVGLLATFAVEMIFSLHRPVMSVVASLARHAVPEHAHEVAIKYLGLNDRGFFIILLIVAGCLAMAIGGVLARARRWRGVVAPTVLAAVAVVAVATETSGRWEYFVPIAVGWVLSLVLLFGVGRLLDAHLEARAALPQRPSADGVDRPAPSGAVESEVADSEAAGTEAVERATTTRRTLIAAVVTVAVAGGAAGVAGQKIGRRRRRVAGARTLVRLPELTAGRIPTGAQSPVAGAPGWRTANADFFIKDTVLRTPTVDPDQWLLRVNGMVRQELQLSYADLVRLPLTEQWTTLACADRDTGHVGTAWWTGVRVADVLNWAGVRGGADTVVQTSEDGWQCRTPLSALLADDALLAFGMNGEVLPTEHGFPVRTVVPGLVGDVSACKWVVDLRVIRAADEPTEEPSQVLRVPTRARLDLAVVPERPGDPVQVSGTVWGADLRSVTVQVQVEEDAPWLPVDLLPQGPTSPSVPRHVWRQFVTELDLPPGENTVRVRATGPGGVVSEPHTLGVKVPSP